MSLLSAGNIAGTMQCLAAGGQLNPRGILQACVRNGAGDYTVTCTRQVLLGETHLVLALSLAAVGVQCILGVNQAAVGVTFDIDSDLNDGVATNSAFHLILIEIAAQES